MTYSSKNAILDMVSNMTGRLADRIKDIDPDICVEGHWVPVDTQDILSDLTGAF